MYWIFLARQDKRRTRIGRVLAALVIMQQLTAAGGAALQFDMRMLKVRCCAADVASGGVSCEYLPVGATSCPAGLTADRERRGWECTAHDACGKLQEALAMMNLGQIKSEACHRALREVHNMMKVDTCGRPTVEGVGRKCASAVRTNLAVAVLMQARDVEALRSAHRLLTMALLCDDENSAAVHNLVQLGGHAACADMADHGEPLAGKECDSVPGYHLRMLHDTARNSAYESAIEWALRQRPGARVLDIGAGSGLLAFLSAAHGARRVDALEMVLPVAAVARANTALNALGHVVKVWPVKSHDFPQHALPQSGQDSYHADIIVHEIFDPSLLGEGVLPAMRDAAGRLASAETILVPHAAHAYVSAVHSDPLSSHRWPPRQEQGALGVDYSVVEAYASTMFQNDAPIIETQNMPTNFALTDRVPVLSLDFRALPYGGGRSEHRATVIAAGRLSALLLTFDAEFPDGGRISTNPNSSLPPGDIPRCVCTHAQCQKECARLSFGPQCTTRGRHAGRCRC